MYFGQHSMTLDFRTIYYLQILFFVNDEVKAESEKFRFFAPPPHSEYNPVTALSSLGFRSDVVVKSDFHCNSYFGKHHSITLY